MVMAFLASIHADISFTSSQIKVCHYFFKCSADRRVIRQVCYGFSVAVKTVNHIVLRYNSDKPEPLKFYLFLCSRVKPAVWNPVDNKPGLGRF